MKLYKIYTNGDVDYDEFDSCVVAANSEAQARKESVSIPGTIEVEYLGKAKRGIKVGVIVSSFNAG